MPKLSNWFHRPVLSGNGSAPSAPEDSADSSAEDEPPDRQSYSQLMPRTKRMRFTDPSRNQNSTEIIPPSPIEKVTPQNCRDAYEIAPEDVSTPQRKQPAFDASPYKRPANQMFCTESGATKDFPVSHCPSSSMKRKSIFESTALNEYSTRQKPLAKPSTKRDGSTSVSRPAQFGSPFYPGWTVYGGSFSQYIKQLQGANVQSSPGENQSVNMSYTSRKVMDLLENYSSPLKEASRIPQDTQSLSPAIDSPDSNKSQQYSYKRRELYLPYKASLMQAKQRRMMETTKVARNIFASHSSSISSNFSTSSGAHSMPISSYNKSPKKESSTPKMKSHLTRLNRGDNPLEMPEPVQLPTAVLQIDKNDLPKFSFSGATTVAGNESTSSPSKNSFNTNSSSASTVSSNNKVMLSPQPVNMSSTFVPNQQEKMLHVPVPQWPKETNAIKKSDILQQSYTFSIPLMIETKVSINQENTPSRETALQYTFVIPQTMNNEKPKSHLPEKAELASQEEPNKKSTAKPTNDWQCSDCWVNNKNDAEKCVCCSAKRPAKVDTTPITITDSKSANDWKCEECWVNNKSCSAKRPPIEDSAKRPTGGNTVSELISSKPTNEWNCPECWVSNKFDSATCVCCSTKRPGNEAAPAIRKCSKCKMSNNQSDSDMCEICEKVQLSKSIALPIPMPADPTKWKCQGCWVSNEGSAQKCVCCGTDKPSSTTTLAKPTESNVSNENMANESGEKQSANRASLLDCPPHNAQPKKLYSLSPKSNPDAKTQQEKWECPSCLVRNEHTKSLCVCCYTERSTSNVKQEKLPAKSTFDFGTTNTTFKFGINPETNAQQEKIEIKTEVIGKRESDSETETNNNTVSKSSFVVLNAVDQATSEATVISKPTFTFGIPKQNTEAPATPAFSTDISTPVQVQAKQEPQKVPSVDLTVPADPPKPFSGYFTAANTSQEAPKTFGTFNLGNNESSSKKEPAPFTFGSLSPNKGSFSSNTSQSNEKKELAPFTFGSLNENKTTFSTLSTPSTIKKNTPGLFSFGSSGKNKVTFGTSGALVSNDNKESTPFTFGENKVTSQVTPSPFSLNNPSAMTPGNSIPMFATPNPASTSSISFGIAQSTPATTTARTQVFPDPQFQAEPTPNLFQRNESTTSKLFTATSTPKSAPVLNPGFNFGSNSQTQPQEQQKFNFSFGSSQQTGNSAAFTPFKGVFGEMSNTPNLFSTSVSGPTAAVDDNTMGASSMSSNSLGGAAPIADSGMQQNTPALFGAPTPTENAWGSGATNSTANMFGNASTQKPALFTFGAPNSFSAGQNQPAQAQPLFGAQPAAQPAANVFGSGAMFPSALPTTNLFGGAQPSGLFGASAQPTPAFEPMQPQTPQSQTPAAFNFSFGFGNQGQQPQPQPQPQPPPQQPGYNFGSGLQFNIGSAPAAPNGRRPKLKAMRRIPPR